MFGSTGFALERDGDSSFSPGNSKSVDIQLTDDGWTIRLTQPGMPKSSSCVGTYTLRKVSGNLEWGSQNTCDGTNWAPQRIDVKVEGTCNDPWCVLWYTEAGPVSSGYTYSRVATVFQTTKCNTSELRRFRISVHIWFQGGAIDYGTAVSAPWSDVPCDF